MKFLKFREYGYIHTFIGHSHRDKGYADTIYLSLQRIVPLTPYIAEYFPNYGEDYKKRIMAQLDRSTFIIFILSQNGINSQWVNQEIGYAHALRRKKGIPFIIPITNKNLQLSGLITQDSTDVLFEEEYPNPSWVIANVIIKIRSNLQDAYKKGALEIKVDCTNCHDKDGNPYEFKEDIPSMKTLDKAYSLNQTTYFAVCPKCKKKIPLDNRTWLPIKQASVNSLNK